MPFVYGSEVKLHKTTMHSPSLIGGHSPIAVHIINKLVALFDSGIAQDRNNATIRLILLKESFDQSKKQAKE